MRVIHNLVQGSPEWHQHRAKHFNASDAPAMLGLSPYKSRDQLLKELATGVTPDVDDATQRRFDDGHANEAAARVIAEVRLGEDLYPIIASLDVDGLPLSASYDGATMDESDIWEHKTLNSRLRSALESFDVPAEYAPQLEQQLLVLGANRVYFCASNGTEDTFLGVWYESNPELRARLIAGWKQFKADLDAYQFVEAKPVATAEPIRKLPALMVNLVGEVTSSNLTVYEETALSFIRAINTDLRTDQDFANAEAMVKFCDNAEGELETVKKMALSQTSSIDELFRTIDGLKEQMRAKRLELEKLVKSRKETIKIETHQRGEREVAAHIAALNARLSKPYMPVILGNFSTVTKGKKTLDGLTKAVNDEVARVKIEASAIADRIELNLKALKAKADGFQSLFPDASTLVLKEVDMVSDVIDARIGKHKAEVAANEEAQRVADSAKKQADEHARALAATVEEQQAKKHGAEAEKALDIAKTATAKIVAHSTFRPNFVATQSLIRDQNIAEIIEAINGFDAMTVAQVVGLCRQLQRDANQAA